MPSNLTAPLMRGVSALSMLSVLAAASASAQQTPPAPFVLDAITITGEKRDRDLKSTASSVAVKTAKEIAKEKTGSPSVSEAINDVPNLIYPDSVSVPVIRGIDAQGPNTGANAFFAGSLPRTTINLDGHYLNYNEFYYGATSVWDLDSIEVFRGPQTTSQGANAIGGAIIVNTKDPTFTPEAAYQAEIGTYSSRRASAMLSGPIFGDELAGRLAVDYSGRDTFIDYVNPAYRRNDTDVDFQSLSARLKLLWQPSKIPGLEAKFTYAHTDTNRPSQEMATLPFKDLNSAAATMPSWKQKTNTGVLDVSYAFDNGVKLFNRTEVSDSAVRRIANVRTSGDADVDQRNISNESRVAFGEQDDVLSGVGGVFYNHLKSDEELYLNGVSTFDDTKRNLGLFGELTYRVTDRWTFNGGLRWQRDEVKRAGTSVYTRTPVNFDATFSAVLPKASLAYAVTPDWNVGALVSRGYNPGGVSLNLTSGRWSEFKKEALWNYELFTRATFLDDRVAVNGNLFYMDLKNAQYNIPVIVSPGVTQSYTINAEKAHAYGFEVNVDYRVLDTLTLKAGAGVLRTEIDEIASNRALAGNEFAKSPGYTLSLGASWDITEKLTLSGQLRHIDGYYSNVENTRQYAVDPYTVADARLSYQFADSFQVYGYVKNIFDDRSATYKQVNRSVTGGIEASVTPRLFGFGVRGSF